MWTASPESTSTPGKSSSRSSSRSRYDYLVLGLGAEVNFFGVEGAAEHAFPLYTLADAVRLKNQVLRLWEDADKHPDLIEDGALNIVVVGGGPTGVETAGALAELYNGRLPQGLPRRRGGREQHPARRGVARDFLHVQA